MYYDVFPEDRIEGKRYLRYLFFNTLGILFSGAYYFSFISMSY